MYYKLGRKDTRTEYHIWVATSDPMQQPHSLILAMNGEYELHLPSWLGHSICDRMHNARSNQSNMMAPSSNSVREEVLNSRTHESCIKTHRATVFTLSGGILNSSIPRNSDPVWLSCGCTCKVWDVFVGSWTHGVNRNAS